MKKIICIILIVVSCSFLAQSFAAPPDLSIYTYDQLIALHLYIGQEIMSRPEWKEVTVPTGDWIVKVDIPEGEYSIRPVKSAYVLIKDTKGNIVLNEALSGSDVVGKVNLKSAYTVHISGSVIFAPAIGLGF